MDLLQMGTQILSSQLGSSVSTDDISNTLGGLIGDGDTMNIASLMEKMQGNDGLGALAASWLGDGANASITPSQLGEVLDAGKLEQAASLLGTNQESLLSLLTAIVPQMVDSGSKGGSLLDSVGGLEGLAGMAKGFFR
jgi:uncharacterized protein YidB (DUF937 family)